MCALHGLLLLVKACHWPLFFEFHFCTVVNSRQSVDNRNGYGRSLCQPESK